MPLGILPVPPRRGRALQPIFVISLILLVLEASQSTQCFFEISSMPCGHCVGTNKNRTDPKIVAVHIEFFFCSNVCVVLVRQLVHLTTDFFSATQFNHGLSESFITDEPIVNTQEIYLLAFLLERIRDEVLVIPFFLPVAVVVGSPFLDVINGNRKEIKSELEVLLVLFRSISQEVPARAVDDADVPIRQTYFALCFGFHIE